MYLMHHELETGRRASPKTAANIVSKLVYNNREHFSAGLIVGGLDENDKPQLWQVPVSGDLLPKELALSGSGSTYIMALADRIWPGAKASEAEAVEAITTCVSHAMAIDGSSGGIVRLAIITKQGIETRVLLPDQLPIHTN